MSCAFGWLLDGDQEVASRRRKIVGIIMLHHYRKFVSSKTEDLAWLCSPTQSLGDNLDQIVTGRVTESIVH